MLNYIRGGLLSTPDKLIAHGCNTMGVMGAGVALAIKEKYPWAFETYANDLQAMKRDLQWHQTNDAIMGRVIYASHGGKIIANCLTQMDMGRQAIRYASYDAIDKCMKRLNNYMEQFEIASISMPKIGCGLGGGEWPIVEAIIAFHLKDVTVNVWELNGST